MASFLALECRGGNLFLGCEELRGGSSTCFRSMNRGNGFGRCLRLKPNMKGAQATLTARVDGGLGRTGSRRPITIGSLTAVDEGAAIRRRTGDGPTEEKRSRTSKEPISHKRIDDWMSESITEIVRNIGEAPFLVHIFSNNATAESAASVRLEREAAAPERWPGITRRWDDDGSSKPDGVILVEELTGKDGGGAEDREEGSGGEESSSDGVAPSSRTWGLLVQGRGIDSAACYILNTCRVRSSLGFCTQFCLVRAKCFGDTAEMQLREAWLLPARETPVNH